MVFSPSLNYGFCQSTGIISRPFRSWLAGESPTRLPYSKVDICFQKETWISISINLNISYFAVNSDNGF